MKTIFVKNGTFRGRPLVLPVFPFDHQLKDLAKTLPDAEWNPGLKARTIPYADSVISELPALFKGKAWLNYGEFKKVKRTPQPEILPVLHSALAAEIRVFSDWMRNRRYSESTIKNYSQGIGLFFRFLQNKDPEPITNADLELFNKDDIISRKYAASFQSGVIHAVKLFFSNRLNRKLEPELVERPRQPRLLPHVLSQEDVKLILQAHQNIKHRTMLSLICAFGLRRGELLNLKPQYIDSQRGIMYPVRRTGNVYN